MNSPLKKLNALIVLLILSTLSLSLAGLATANFTPLPTLPAPVYLRSDGSVDPLTAPLQRVGDTYTFTNNINNTIEVQRSNIVLDGNGFALTKPTVNTEDLMMPVGWLPGVHVVGINNVTITNIAFEYCITGVTIQDSLGITISQNTIREAKGGIVVLSSSDINIIGNNITLSNQSFATGINFLPSNPEASSPYHIQIGGNQITGNSNEVPASPPQPEQYGIWGGFSNSQMVGNDLTGIKGIALYYTGSNNLIAGNNFQDNYEGILFSGSSDLSVNSTIYGNNFNHNSRNAVVPFIRNPPPNLWDNGTIGNYWSDYSGTDVNGDGIGDSPYIIETVYYDYELSKNVTVQEGKDNFPLMAPVDTPKVVIETTPLPNPSPSVSLSPSPSPTPIPSPNPSQTPTSSPTQFPTPSASLSGNPTSTPNTNQNQPLPQEVIYGAGIVGFVVIVLAVVFAVRRQQPRLS